MVPNQVPDESDKGDRKGDEEWLGEAVVDAFNAVIQQVHAVPSRPMFIDSPVRMQ